MLQHTPSYSYVLEGGKRSFHHRWIVYDQLYDCDSCNSSCDWRAPYNQHWQSVAAQQHTRLHLSEAQEQQMMLVERLKVQLFLLCNRNVQDEAVIATRQFLLEAGVRVIPELLRLLYSGAQKLRLKIGFDVRVQQDLLLFQSSELSVLHHFDIVESVDMLFHMLLQKIRTYVSLLPLTATTADYKVQRIRLQVRRVRPDGTFTLPLPLQYRVKHAVAFAAGDEHETLMAAECQHLSYHSSAELARATDNRKQLRALTGAYKRHLRLSSPEPVIAATVNLYAFQICHQSRELFVVPYYLADPQRLLQTASYIISEDVAGRFQNLQQITHVRRFFRHDAADRVLICRKCKAQFVQQTTFELHKMLQCGHAFEVLKFDCDAIEIYERCLRLPQLVECEWGTLYGVLQ